MAWIMDVRTVRPGWFFSLCLVPSSVASKHNVGIPKFGNPQSTTFTLWMNLERHPRKLKEKNLPFFYSQTRGFSLAVIPEGYLELRGNQKHEVMPCYFLFFWMHLEFCRMS